MQTVFISRPLSGFLFLAQTYSGSSGGLLGPLSGGAAVIQGFGMLGAIAGLIYSTLQAKHDGRTANIFNALVCAVVGGLASIIVAYAFKLGGAAFSLSPGGLQ